MTLPPTKLPPAEYGPFHRRKFDPAENEKIVASSTIRGAPRRNIYAGDFPAVKAFDGELPQGIPGIEFYTEVAPDPWSVPCQPEWSEGRPGVVTLIKNQLVEIPVIITKRRD